MKENPGKVITRYDFRGLFSTAYHKDCNMGNAARSFRSTGIFPFYPSAISDDIFGSSTVSKLPDAGGDHHTDNGITEKTDAKSDGDIHVPETRTYRICAIYQ